MARHPDVFLTKRKFEQALTHVGCHASYAPAAASDFSVMMPLLIHALGKERFFEIVEAARPEVYLDPAPDAWKASIRYITAWADAEIEQFIQRKVEEQSRS